MSEESKQEDFDDDDMVLSDDEDMDLDIDDADVTEDIVPVASAKPNGMSARQRLESYMEMKRSERDLRDVFDEFDDFEDD